MYKTLVVPQHHFSNFVGPTQATNKMRPIVDGYKRYNASGMCWGQAPGRTSNVIIGAGPL